VRGQRMGMPPGRVDACAAMKIAQQCPACSSIAIDKNPAVLAPFVAARVFDWQPVEITPEWGLRDIRTGRAYCVCNTAFCTACHFLFLDMRFDPEEMARLYTGYRDDAYTRLRETFEPGYIARNAALLEGASHIAAVEEVLRPHIPERPRILDWGGDTGLNTPFRRRAELHHIFDISNRPVVSGAMRVTTETMNPGGYDLVVLSNVLEHVPYPVSVLQEVISATRRDAVLYIEVPDEALVRKAIDISSDWTMKRHWHEHINFFSPRSLQTLLARCGLEQIHASSIATSSAGSEGHVFAVVAKIAPQ
jgi:hypothetical protein